MNVFLSWSGEVAKLAAEEFHKWLRRALPAKRIKIYFSPKSNDPGAPWRQALRRALAQSSLGMFFLTRESISSPWVLFEGGAVGKLGHARVFTVLLDLGIADVAALAPPFEEYQAVPLGRDDLWRVVEAIANRVSIARASRGRLRGSFDSWWPNFKQAIDRVIATDLTAVGDWRLVSQASVVSRIARSPFEAKYLFRVARKRLDFVAQNHYFMTVEHEADHLDLLRNFLSRKGRAVTILAMNPRNAAAVRSWTELMGTKDFPDDLRKAVETLRKWKGIASKEKWKGKLDIRLAGLIPTSQTFFDGESDHGGLVLTPMGRKPSNTDRSVFVLRKAKNREAFDGYWTTYTEHLRRAQFL